MNDSTLDRYLAIARRQWWVVLQATIIVGLVAGFLAWRDQTSSYEARAQLYVGATVGSDGKLPLVAQPTYGPAPALPGVLVSSLAREATSPPVLTAAAKKLGVSPGALGASITPVVSPSARTITLVTEAAGPARATAVANAVAHALVDTRWQARQAQLQSKIDATTSQLSDIQGQITAITRQEAAAALGGGDTSSFETAKSVWLSQYQSVFANQQALQTSLQSQDNGVQFLLPAQGAAEVKSTSPLNRALEGAALGFVIGLGLAALREALDRKVRDRQWVEEATGLRTIGELPREAHLRRARLVVADEPGSPYAEGVRALRSALAWSVPQGKPASLAVTSAQSGDGKTTLAANLAAAWALTGLRTVLVSADVRSPTIHRELFSARDGGEQALHKPSRGLAELLLDVEADLADPTVVDGALLYTRVENLRWLPATLTATRPAAEVTRVTELLATSRARTLFGTLAGIADVVVIDTPPAALADAAAICGLADGTVLVVRADRTRRSALRRTVTAWRGAPVTALGVVFNGVRHTHDTPVTSGSGATRRTRKQRKADEVAWQAAPPLRAVGDGSGASHASPGTAGTSEL